MAAKKKPKGGLGRGLSAILTDNDGVVENAAALTEIGKIPISQIQMINQFQPRNDFDEKALNELADSIRLHGIIQPLTVRKLENNTYQLIAGERRYRAAKLCKLTEVPVYIRTANDEEMLEMALIENIQREDLNPIEIAHSFQRMIDELALKQEELGDKVGKERSTVTNYISLLRLAPEIKKGLKERVISMGHAKALKGIDNSVLQLSIYKDIVAQGLSVRKVEEIARAHKNAQKAAPKEKTEVAAHDAHQIQLNRLSSDLENKFGNRVKIKQNKQGKGEIQIAFNSTKDLNRILEILNL